MQSNRESLGGGLEKDRAILPARAQQVRPGRMLREEMGFLPWPAHSVWSGSWTLGMKITYLENQMVRTEEG